MPSTLEIIQFTFCVFVGFVGALAWFSNDKTSADGTTFHRLVSLFSATLLTGLVCLILIQFMRWVYVALIAFLFGILAEMFIRLYMQYISDSSGNGFIAFIRNMRTAYDVAKNATDLKSTDTPPKHEPHD